MHRGRKRDPRLLWAILLALVLHGLSTPLVTKFLLPGRQRPVTPPRQFLLTLEKRMEPTKPKEQVVTITPPRRERRPRRAHFLSEFDSSVRKETKARRRRLGSLLTRGSARRVHPKPQEDVERRLRRQPDPLTMRPEERPGRPLPEKPGEHPPRGKPRPPSKPRLTLADLRLTRGALRSAVGSAFPDALRDVPEGDQTLLNTKRWRFSSFFNRVKRAVAQHWHPDVVYKRRDPTGRLYGYRSRLTVVRVWLYPDGRLKDVVLLRSCGLPFLDEEAIRAFRAAAPFPNPPKRLVDPKTRLITFRFGFLFEIVEGPVLRIFRYR